ncbi:hypothetical protein LENED_008984 [Lentinula edodes]|uniref:Uncharacterized protein n=1 Tax=Lentinula edodes TaxID=5353 RepID=A0A1Q3EIK1_LENED|nr:hypothetical protein LENED_008984 [Lentinula edodes]
MNALMTGTDKLKLQNQVQDIPHIHPHQQLDMTESLIACSPSLLIYLYTQTDVFQCFSSAIHTQTTQP